jgi:DNA-binding transcriptional ArsR family regulator
MSEQAPNYYAIIPANVRYDKTLIPNAKLLYGEITALCSKEGYCWASNAYFADLYDVSMRAISGWISQLAEKNYITLELIYREGSKEIQHRYIRLFPGVAKKTSIGQEENFHPPIEENFQYITTRKNNITMNEREESEASASPPPPPVRIGTDGTSRFERAKTAGAVCFKPVRKYLLDLGDEDRRQILATLSHYSDNEIAEAIKTYAEMLTDDRYDIFAPYASLIGFLRSGVEKFVDEAKPRDVFRKRSAAEASQEKIDWEKIREDLRAKEAERDK